MFQSLPDPLGSGEGKEHGRTSQHVEIRLETMQQAKVTRGYARYGVPWACYHHALLCMSYARVMDRP
jgi:hypothetical protein